MVLQQRLIFVPNRQWYVLRAMPTSASRLSALTCGSSPAFLTGIVFSRFVRLSGSAPGSFPTSSADTGAAIAPYGVAIALLAAAGIALFAVRKSTTRRRRD